MTCRILTRTVGPLHTVTLMISDSSAFRDWRVEVRNRVDYLRRVDPPWKDLGFCGWLQRDEFVRGIVSLGALGSGEVMKGLARWQAVLGTQMEPEDLRVTIWSVTKPTSISLGADGARYQGLKLNIWPRREPARSTTSWRPRAYYNAYDPMPVVV